MNAKELRFGNMLVHNGRVDGNVHFVNVVESVCERNILDINSNPNNYSPLFISEEWLTKFGFVKKSKHNSYLGEYLSGDIGKIHLRYYVIKGFIQCILNDNIVTCYYVHQLQNLYFTLIEKELTITPTNE